MKQICRDVFSQGSHVQEIPIQMRTNNGIQPVRLYATSCPDAGQSGDVLFIEIHVQQHDEIT